MARNVTMEDSGFLAHRRYLLHDRDTKYCSSFRQLIEAGDVRTLALPARSPNLNAYAERWVRSVKEECLSKLIFLGEGSLRRALHHYQAHYHQERNHQGKAACCQSGGGLDSLVKVADALASLEVYKSGLKHDPKEPHNHGIGIYLFASASPLNTLTMPLSGPTLLARLIHGNLFTVSDHSALWASELLRRALGFMSSSPSPDATPIFSRIGFDFPISNGRTGAH